VVTVARVVAIAPRQAIVAEDPVPETGVDVTTPLAAFRPAEWRTFSRHVAGRASAHGTSEEGVVAVAPALPAVVVAAVAVSVAAEVADSAAEEVVAGVPILR
jgi:hypothetical protein